MSMNRFLRHLTLAAAFAPLVAASGCGPGFPIMTSSQEQLLTDVENLKERNRELASRVESLEAGTGLSTEVEELRFALADTNRRLDELRREFSFVQGSMEGLDRKATQAGADLETANDKIASMEERVKAIEESAQSILEGFKAAEGADGGASTEETATLRQRLAGLEERLAAVETRVAVEGVGEPSKDPEALYLEGYQLTMDEDFATAEKTFRTFLKKHPTHKFAENAQYWLAETFYSRGDWERAIIEFDKVIKNYPGGDKVPAAMLKQGFSFDRLGSTAEARVLLQEVVDKYPKSRESDLAKKRLESMKE